MTYLMLKILSLNKWFSQIYTTELQFDKADSFDSGASFLYMDLSIIQGIVLFKLYYNRGDFKFEIVHVPFLEGDAPRFLFSGLNY